jgi:mRNA-degrading endonuclease RelE of RelBE toxin-antitoxin system
LAKRTPYTLIVRPEAKAELEAFRVFQRRAIADAIDANLLFDPLARSRRRKGLGEPQAGFEYRPPLWELKVGEFRVFYDVDEQIRTVYVRSVRRKPPEQTTEEVLR